MLLEALRVPPDSPADIIPALDGALAGERSVLPIPGGHDDYSRHRAQLLRHTMRSGESIDNAALVMCTSGSTGVPKGAMLTAENLLASAIATRTALGGGGHWVLALPAHHIAGVQVLVRSLVDGTTPGVCPVDRGFSVSTFAEVTRHTRKRAKDGSLFTSLVPNQLLKAMDTLAGIEALRLFDAILVGGAPLTEKDRTACQRLGLHVVQTYGSTETSGGCVYDGRPIDWARIRITGERIHLGGKMVASGYRNINPEETDAFAHPGWFSTSDTGYFADGMLHVTGRLDAIIDSGGLKLHPEVLERELEAVDGVQRAGVAGVPDARLGQRIVAVYEGTAEPSRLVEALDHLPRWQLPKEIRRVEKLPLTALAKVDRARIAELFAPSPR